MNLLISLSILFSFLLVYFTIPKWIDKAKEFGFVGRDMHKKKSIVAEGGGVVVLFGIVLGILFYIAIETFYMKNTSNLIKILAFISVLLLSAIVGLLDDLLGWKKGLSRKIRLLIIAFAAIPLMAIDAGHSTMILPFLGSINLGLLYPLFIIPFGIVGATATFNFLAGYNGLEASQGILILSALAIATYITGSKWLSIICLYGVVSLIAFYFYNKTPAKVFPGDVLTYVIGSFIAVVVILGNLEKFGIFIFSLYIIETFLKVRGGLVKESFAKLNKDGSLEVPYEKIYGLEHLSIYLLKKIKPSHIAYEREVVWTINFAQLIIILLSFLFFI